MKLDWNRKYTTIAIYAFLVIAAGLLFQQVVNDIPPLTKYFGMIGDLLMPFAVGGALAYILNPVLNWIVKTAGLAPSYIRMIGTVTLDRFAEEKVIEHVEAPGLWEQMHFGLDEDV